jgi:hypothetical protein
MRTLLIDDEKQPSQFGVHVDRIARNYNDGIAALKEGPWDLLLLDHDLKDFTGPNGTERKGWYIVRWLARPGNRKYIPGEIECVSHNPEGRRVIEKAIRDLYRDPNALVTVDPEYMQAYYEGRELDE